MSFTSKFNCHKNFSSILDKNLDFEKKFFNFKKKPKLLVGKINKREIKGLPFFCLSKSNIPIILKVFPIEKEKSLDNSDIEISYLDLFNRELLDNFILPSFPVLYTYTEIPNTKECLGFIPFKKLDKISELEGNSRVLLCEYVVHQDIDFWYENIIEKNIHTEVEKIKNLKSIIFQVIFSIAVLQDKYDFIHYDLHPGNILIDEVSDENFHYKFGIQNFYINSRFVAKIWDFEFSNIFKGEYGIFANPVTSSVKYSEIYDIYKFLKGILEIEFLPDDIISFIESLYPYDLLYNRKERLFLSEDIEELESRGFPNPPTPRNLINHDFFKEYNVKDSSKKYVNFLYTDTRV